MGVAARSSIWFQENRFDLAPPVARRKSHFPPGRMSRRGVSRLTRRMKPDSSGITNKRCSTSLAPPGIRLKLPVACGKDRRKSVCRCHAESTSPYQSAPQSSRTAFRHSAWHSCSDSKLLPSRFPRPDRPDPYPSPCYRRAITRRIDQCAQGLAGSRQQDFIAHRVPRWRSHTDKRASSHCETNNLLLTRPLPGAVPYLGPALCV